MSFREIVPGLTQIDVQIPREGYTRFLSVWLLRDEEREQTLLVETGPASSLPRLFADLGELSVGAVDYLLYTHIHLDNAGGAGQFLERHPETRVVAPLKGLAHLAAPDRLYQASMETLGADLVMNYGEPRPVPGLAFAAAAPPGVTVIETPGHAPHHDSFLYELGGRKILFAGEAAGFYYRQPDRTIYQRPAAPHRFFYDRAMESLEKLAALEAVDMICFPHYGCASSRDVRPALENAMAQMRLWKEVVSACPGVCSDEKLYGALMERDALLRAVCGLDAAEAARERFYVRQSIKGFRGYSLDK